MAEQKKICDILAENAKDATKTAYSFEFFPPRTEKGEESLKKHLVTLAALNPVFVDFTWGAGGTTSEQTPKWCLYCKDELKLTVNMHLTCTNMAEGKVHEALDFCKKNGIRNLVALRGDPPAGEEWKASKDGFNCALDLVKYIRKNYGDYFSVAVAGYPEGHPDRIDTTTGSCPADEMKKEIEYLKAKVDAGGDYIITQLFYDTKHFLHFAKTCREVGITVPILPGMLPMISHAGLNRMVQLCKTYIPEDVKAKAEELKEDDAAFKEYGIQLTSQHCAELAESGTRHFHFYTLNMDHSTVAVMKNLGLIKN